MKEVWKDIKGYEGYYEISNLGRVKSLKRHCANKYRRYISNKKIILRQCFTSTGYKYVNLTKNKKSKSFKVHRLVGFAFLGEPPKGKEIINHIDGNPINNNANNLEWCNQKENIQHALKSGLIKSFKINKSDLKKDLEYMSIKQIAKKYNTKPHTIVNNIVKYNLKGKNRIFKTGITPKMLKEKLKYMSQSELSKELGCTRSNISHMLNEFKRRGLL